MSARIVKDVQDKLRMAMDVKFGYSPRRDRRLTESARREYPQPHDLPSMRELLQHLQEATTANIPVLMGSSMTKALVSHYTEDDPQEWRRFIAVGRSDDFREQDRVIFGEYGGIPKRAEAAQYADLGFPSEYVTKFSPDSRGGIVRVTREMILNDDTQALQRIPQKLASAAAEELRRFAYGMVAARAGGGGINSDLMYDNQAVYHIAHGNLGTLALDVDNVLACRARLLSQWLPGQETTIDDDSGINDTVTTIGVSSVDGYYVGAIVRIENELIKVGGIDVELKQFIACTRGMYGTTAAAHSDGLKVQLQARPVRFKSLHLVVPTQLESKAYEVLASEKLPGGNFNNRNFLNQEHEDGKIEVTAVHPTYLGDDVNNWYMVADPESIPSLAIDFVQGQETPEVILADQPTNSDVFNLDVIPYKIRHEYGGRQVDWRGLQGNLVTGG